MHRLVMRNKADWNLVHAVRKWHTVAFKWHVRALVEAATNKLSKDDLA